MVNQSMTEKSRIYSGGKDSLFNKWWQKNWTATCKIMRLEHSSLPYTKTNSRSFKVLNGRMENHKTSRREHWQYTLLHKP